MKFRKFIGVGAAIVAALAICSAAAHAQTCPGLAVSVQPFTPTGGAALAVNWNASSIALPTNSASTPPATTVVIQNPQTTYPVYVQLGDSSVVADTTNGFQIVPGASATIAIHANTHLSAIAPGNVPLHINTGY